ncbi:hypothetical protein N6Y36_05560 [Morganella morganii]|nr:hypothetical protein N6Y36_05560 [Morganella morganii]
MRILLILPFDRTYRYRKSAFSVAISYAPLTLITLAALVPPHLNAELTLCDEGVSPPVTAGDFDLVVITATASSSPAPMRCAATGANAGQEPQWAARTSHCSRMKPRSMQIPSSSVPVNSSGRNFYRIWLTDIRNHVISTALSAAFCRCRCRAVICCRPAPT